MMSYTLPISLRFNHAARYALASFLFCVSLLISACGGGADTGTSTASSSSIPVPPPPSSYTLTVSNTGSGSIASAPGGINCGSSCSASYTSGSNVTLTATAATGYSFSGWSGSGISCPGTGTCTVPMSANRGVTATFIQNSPSNYNLSVARSGSGTVTSAPSGINCGSSCSASYTSGTNVTLTATPATGYSFSGWSGACAGTSPTCAISMTVARSVTATFIQNSASNSTYIISWDQVTDPNVTGYRLYYATAPLSSSPQMQSINVGSVTSYEVTASALGLSTGTTVYFAVTAIGNGLESPLSGPVSAILE